jgi:hypothetical protein
MNDKIKELAERANLQDGWFCGQGNIEKFAELVVRECMITIALEGQKIAQSMPVVDVTNYVKMSHLNGMIDAAMAYSEKIKKHFGVGE